MDFSTPACCVSREYIRRADGELRLEMRPFVRELADGERDFVCRTFPSDFPSVKRVAARCSFVGDSSEIRGDCCTRVIVQSEASELRMIAVAARFSAQHGLREEGFAPACEESRAVEMSGMERPKTHHSDLKRKRYNTQNCVSFCLL